MDDRDGEPSRAVRISSDEIERLCDFLYRRPACPSPSKRYFIDRRLEERIVATGSSSFQAYFSLLRADADHEIEI